MNGTLARLLTATLAITLVTLTLSPSANADRRSSLGGNLLIEDPDDVLIFPHTALKHTRLYTIDLALNDVGGGDLDGAFGAIGNTGLIIGDESFALGVFAHRSDFVNNLATAFSTFGDIDSLVLTGGGLVGNPSPVGFPFGEPFSSPLQWVDVVTAFDLGGSPLGVRLSLGHADNSSEAKAGDAVNINDNSATVLNLLVGYGMGDDEGFKLDLAAELSFGFQNLTTDPDGDAITEESTSNIPSISLLARGKSNLAKGVDLGFIGLLDFRSASSESNEQPANNVSGTSASTIGLEAGAGPIYHVADRFTISAYATLGFRNIGEDPETNSEVQNDEVSTNIITLPQLRISAEFYVFDWLLLRTGAQFVYAFAMTSQQAGENNENSTSTAGSLYRWVSGVGIDLGDLQINGTLNHDFLLDGPNFIGGGEGMFAMMNLTYDFE
jgi:hypothetical protein